MHKPIPRLPALPPLNDPLPFLSRALDWNADDLDRARRLVESGLPPLATVPTLPFVFGVSHSLVNVMRRHPARFYKRFEIDKASGGTRVILAPRVALKLIQRWLHEQVLVGADSANQGTAFRPGSSVFRNASVHLGARNLLQTDLVDFYGSIRRESVVEIFRRFGFSELVANQLADLTTLDGSLPQGASTSPMLSNLSTIELDAQLEDLAVQLEARYTRYADDIVFSSSMRKFGDEDLQSVQEIASRHGFTLNRRKTRLIGQGYRHVITGVSASSHLQYPRNKRRKWRALFHAARYRPHLFAGQQQRLLGIAAAVSAYDVGRGSMYRDIALNIPLVPLEPDQDVQEPST